MVAEFKSHVLSRDEKGFLGIPFKRLLLAGVGGGLVYTVGKVAFPDWAIPLAVGISVLLVYFTSARGGISRWRRSLYRVRGNLMLAVVQQPGGLSASLARMLELPSELVTLDGGMMFAPPYAAVEADLAEWVTFAQARDADREDGLELVTEPLENAMMENR